jgi:hypothetical protein
VPLSQLLLFFFVGLSAVLFFTSVCSFLFFFVLFCSFRRLSPPLLQLVLVLPFWPLSDVTLPKGLACLGYMFLPILPIILLEFFSVRVSSENWARERKELQKSNGKDPSFPLSRLRACGDGGSILAHCIIRSTEKYTRKALIFFLNPQSLLLRTAQIFRYECIATSLFGFY